MVKKVIYLDVAIRDLSSIYNYISKDSIKYARLEVKKIKAFAESLKTLSLRGKYFKTINNKEVLSIVFKNYIIFYINEPSRVSILTIHHHSRLITNNPAFKNNES